MFCLLSLGEGGVVEGVSRVNSVLFVESRRRRSC